MALSRFRCREGGAMKMFARVQITGPLKSHFSGFAAELRAQGYTDVSAANQLRLMADLSRWLESQRIAPRELVPRMVERFIAKRRRTHSSLVSSRALAPLLAYLRSVKVAPASIPLRASCCENLQGYERHLVERQGGL